MSKIIAVLDACVLYPAPVRDILLNLAEKQLFAPKWSAIIHDEWVRNLLKKRPDLKEVRLLKTVNAMNGAFPDALVEKFEHLIPEIILPDENDRHVAAAGLQCAADFIVTFNLKDFPATILQSFEMIAIHPDDFICKLFDANSDLVKAAFKNPPVSN